MGKTESTRKTIKLCLNNKKNNNIKIIDHPPPYTTITTLLLELSVNVYKKKVLAQTQVHTNDRL